MSKLKIYLSLSVAGAAILAAVVCFCISTNIVKTSDAIIETEKIPVNSQYNGKIVELFVKPNQKVESGQLIAEIEISELQTETAYPAEKETSEKNLQIAEENYTKSAMMYKDGVISQQEYDDSLKMLADARNALTATQNKPASPKSSPVIKKIYASKNGTISQNLIDKGEDAIKNKPIALLDTHNPIITAYFPVKFRKKLKEGIPVSIKSNNDGKIFNGVIDKILSEPELNADKTLHVLPVLISFTGNYSGLALDKNQTFSVTVKK